MSSNICAILEQRRQLALLRKPQNRYEGPTNPYTSGTITQYQLDMRRKVEILKYKKNVVKTNRMTARGRYATVLNQLANDICPGDLSLPTLSSSSDVPGPIINLQYDATVPLYNIASSADNYANLNQNEDTNKIFTLYAENNVLVQNGTTVTVAKITIDTPNESNATFNISIPIGIYISADVSGNNVYDSIYRISSLTFGVYYNGSLVPSTSTQSFTSVNTRVLTTSNRATISGVKYVGNLQISNLTLPTQVGYVYEFRMSAATDVVINVSGNFTRRVFGAFVNVSNDQFVNCAMTATVPTTNSGAIQINAV
jgi:hypothetical protein